MIHRRKVKLNVFEQTRGCRYFREFSFALPEVSRMELFAYYSETEAGKTESKLNRLHTACI